MEAKEHSPSTILSFPLGSAAAVAGGGACAAIAHTAPPPPLPLKLVPKAMRQEMSLSWVLYPTQAVPALYVMFKHDLERELSNRCLTCAFFSC